MNENKQTKKTNDMTKCDGWRAKQLALLNGKKKGRRWMNMKKKRDSVSCIRVYKARRQRSGGGSDANKGSKERGKDR
jgi:hypothetical protein